MRNLVPSCLVVVVLAAYGFADTSLMPNAGFEQGDGEGLAAWRADGKVVPDTPQGVEGEHGVRIVWQEGGAAEGKRCLRMEGKGGGDDYALVSSAPVSLVPGASYRISFRYRGRGLVPEDARRERHASLVADLFVIQRGKGRIDGCRWMTSTNTEDWATLAEHGGHTDVWRMPDVPDCVAVLRFQLVNKFPGNQAVIWVDDVRVEPLDPILPNPGFEVGEGGPEGWRPVGAARREWVTDMVRTGKRAVSVSDAGGGGFSGWSATIPVRPDRTYVFGGYIRGGDLNPDGPIGGGAFAVQFADAAGQDVGGPAVSQAVGARQDWTEAATPAVQPPEGAAVARLSAGLQFCRGTAWFDDVYLKIDKAVVREEVVLARRVPEPSPGVRYAANLLANGTVEEGVDGRPTGWTYVGRSECDWSKEELDELYTKGRPEFKVGRGRGEWSDGIRYAGARSLLNISIDPPLSRNHQWYGRNPVDGYWISDPMPCTPGKMYVASAWIRPGAYIGGAWYGPLHLTFHDSRGRELRPAVQVRCAISEAEAGRWTFWGTNPYTAPEGATTMRLRFAQELKADAGGWGRTYGDNFAVWELPPQADSGDAGRTSTLAWRRWFLDAHRVVRPPYLPSPAESSPYDSCWGGMQNLAVGNLYHDPDAPVLVRLDVASLIGEGRTLTAAVTPTDWLGAAGTTNVSAPVKLDGWGRGTIEIELPPTRRFGAFHLDVQVREGQACVGTFSGRYAVLPPLLRPRTADAVWGVTPLIPLPVEGTAYERELVELMRVCGFRISWVRMHTSPEPADLSARMAEALRVVRWYRAQGIRPVLQIMLNVVRPIDQAAVRRAGATIGREFKGMVAAFGDWGIEAANSASPYRGGGQERLTDEEYDTVLRCLYDGIKSETPEAVVLIGNIATDLDGRTIRRLYGRPAEGRFDGAIFNAYMGQVLVGEGMLAEFDRHGDTGKTVWSEEQAEQRSPFEGEARRYGEADGARNMVRNWLSMIGKLGPRLRAVTCWGFVCRNDQDIMLVTPELQPRPQFVAHAVMADALADARFVADRSAGNVSMFEWLRGDGPLVVAWANSGRADVTLELGAPALTVMDLMGNTNKVEAKAGLATVELTTSPLYLFGGGTLSVSRRLEVRVANGSVAASEPRVRVVIRNNEKTAVQGEVSLAGPVKGAEKGSTAPQPFDLAPGAAAHFDFPAADGLPAGKRTVFRAECRTRAGAVYSAQAGLNFAMAVQTETPPALDGTWKGWEKAPVITFGADRSEVQEPQVPGERYNGPGDILGRLRLMWDSQCLYLGVEALDDVFLPVPTRGRSGFMGDSIEFGIQPDDLLTQTAPRYEYEVYLPGDGGTYAASRRFPAPGGIVDAWQAAVKPTGHRGDVNYQVAIPWRDLGVEKPELGKTISLTVVLNDQDDPASSFSGGRGLIHWFTGVHTRKNPEGFGDVTLVRP